MDLDILLFFQSIRSDPLTALMSAVTYLGSETVVVPVLCVILWCRRKELGYRLGLTLFFAMGLNQTLKILFSVPRPWVRWPEVSPVSSAVADATGYSFPSGHTSTAASVYPTLAMRMGGSGRPGARWRRLAAYGAAMLAVVLVGLSRVYLGVHTASDVIVSAILTLAVVIPANLIYDRVEKGRIRDAAVSAGGLALAAMVTTIAAIVVANGAAVDAEHALDAFKAAGAMAGFAIGWYIERRWIHFDVRASLLIQAVKAVAGIGVLLCIQAGMKPLLYAILPSAQMADTLRYALVALWATSGLPAAAVRVSRLFRRSPRPD